MTTVFFTPHGYQSYLERLERLDQELSALQAKVQNACEVGGDVWHDNASYEHLCEDIRVADRRLSEASAILQDHRVVPIPTSPRHVMIGVEVLLNIDGESKSYKIGGYGEGEPTNNKITYLSPLAQTLIRHTVGETVIFSPGKNHKEQTIRIRSIHPLR